MNVNVNGHIIRSGLPTVNVVTSTPYTVDAYAGYVVLLVDCTSSNIQVRLQLAANNTDCFVIKKIDSNYTRSLTIVPQTGETIDGSSSAVIRVQYSSLTLVSDGTNWHII